MWGDDYIQPGRKPAPDTGCPWITALLIVAAIALILTCLPGVGS